MKVGDYVRTKSDGIKKINGFSFTLEEDFIECDYDKYQIVLINKKEVVKSSSNIIDLIEVGDYVNGRIVGECIYLDKLGLIGLNELEREDEKFIKSIVTKEQFEEMEYKL